MTTTDQERPGAALEVVLGVDTHLDAHVAVALDHLAWQAPAKVWRPCRRQRTATSNSSRGRRVSAP